MERNMLITERNPSSPPDRRKNVARKKSDRRKSNRDEKDATDQSGQKPDRADHKSDAPQAR
jgi:hypothetical protein